MAITFTLNGKIVSVQDAPVHLTLLNYLRASGLTGAKEGCAEGECGACAVVFVREGDDGRARYQPVNSCLVLLPAVAGQEIVTVEHVAAGGGLHPVQAEMIRTGGSQCGYCTPGFVMSLFAEYYRPGRQEFDMEALSGNLCRCTGYRPICEAARSLPAPEQGDPFLQRLLQPGPTPGGPSLRSADEPAPTPVGPVPPGRAPAAPFTHTDGAHRFFLPASLSEALALAQENPGAQYIAGGTDLAVEANQRFRRWPALISLESVPELRRFAMEPDEILLGAGLSLTELQERLGDAVPMLAEWFDLFASRLIRNRATLGGNLANASPIGDGAPALLALGASVRIAGAAGEREVALEEFFTGYRKTALAPGELITAVRIPRPLPGLSRFYKVAKRQRDDISTVAAGFALDLDGSGRVRQARFAFGGVAATPVRARATEALLLGRPWTAEWVAEAARTLAGEFQPISDHRGSAAYRKAMVASLLRKFHHECQGVMA